MARFTNRQQGHVGNLGDVLKHAALCELATLLFRTHGRVDYVETNTFLLHSPVASHEQWARDVDDLATTRPGYARYAQRERTSLEHTGRYRCSAGLVLDVLGDNLGCAVLAEANAVTRMELREQLAAEKHERVLVVDDAKNVDVARTVPDGGALLVHVDPFTLTATGWAEIAAPLDALVSRSAAAVVVIYRYSRNASEPWPTAPCGASAVAQTRGGPHAIGAYATPSIRDAARSICQELGWRMPDEAPDIN
jgi:23S rRNA A2030 N6-methylase RlmJ